MKFSKRIVSLGALLALVACLGAGAAFATNETDDSLAMANVNDEAYEVVETAAEIEEPATVSDDVVTTPQVGDTIWIKSGSSVYKNYENENTAHELIGNYEVKVVEIVVGDDGQPAWYEFEFTSFGIGELYLKYSGYKYVHVENTSVEKPESGDDGSKNEVEYDGKEFAADISVTVKEAEAEDVQRIEEVIPEASEDCIRECFVYDISGEDQDGVEITVNGLIDMEKLDTYGRCSVVVYHLKGSGEIEALEGTVDWDGSVTFETNSFSTFYFMVQYYANDATYTLSVANSVKISTILKECGVPSGFTITNVVADAGTIKDSEGNDVAWATVTNPTSNDAKVALAGSFSGLHTLTVTIKASGETKTYKVDVAVPEIFYYLNDTDWCMDTVDQSFVLDEEDYGTRTTNKVVLNVEDVTGGVVIYARPGMVLQFTTGWRWGTDEAHLYKEHVDNGGWKWFSGKNASEESGDSKNYVIIDEDIEEVTTFTIEFSQNKFESGRLQHGTTATVHVIPNYAPTLLEDVPGVKLKTLPVTLFNYDGNAWKDYYRSQEDYSKGDGTTEETGLFEFKSASSGVPVTVETLTDSINYGNWTMGILENKLDENGLPVVADGYAVDLFSDTAISNATTVSGEETAAAKQVYSDVGFQFVYDSSTGYYTYASQLNAAQYFADSKTVKLYRENLSAADAGASYQSNNAGFYPFINVADAFLNTAGSTGTGTLSKENFGKNEDEIVADPAGRNTYASDEIVTDLAAWQDALDDGYAQYSGYLAKDLVSTYDESGEGTVDMHFGLKLQSQFYLPEGKQVNGQDIEFSFTGDDDLWVFIDGELVLDLGGGHGPISGTINFTEGTVTAENRFSSATSYYQLEENDDGKLVATKVDGEYSKSGYTWNADEIHTLSIFYLEKCSGHSNCYMRFNIPIIPDGDVVVSKTVENQDGQALSVTPDTDYAFTLYAATDDDKQVNAADSDFIPLTNASYTVNGTGAPSGVLETDENGQFTLKDGWTATFQNIEQFTEVCVVEQNPKDGYTYTKSTVSVNKGEAKQYTYGDRSDKKVVLKGSAATYDFVNVMKTQPLTIEKHVVNGTEGLIDGSQKFEFTLNFAKNILETGAGAISATDKSGNAVALTNGGTFQLGHGESVTIPRVPVGMEFSLMEKNPDATNGSFDAPRFESVNCTTADTPVAFDTAYAWTVGAGGENKIVVTNQQRFNLTITKDGIQGVDHDADEQQSTIYTVTGKIGGDVMVEMDVAICGNDSVTICKLPVGSYTVKEKTDWAWRYDPVDGSFREVTIPKTANATVRYENNRSELYWLSGDSYLENWWDSGIIKKRNGLDTVIG